MSLDTQKIDSSQRQQIMATVQQQLAIQHAQELLQKLSDKCFKACVQKPGEWIKDSDTKLKTKHVPISELTASQINRLLPPIYAYRPRIRGQRKRSVISTLQSK
ncbi:unnamed protein product [Rotaria magnacalcarata]|uniref:Tim10-like domain-containing protein n=1 Tax=Rotaria magnacalcarata TaxID=392030 RepID=A0A816VWV7_9BILA|nr:unnamed protein product [Rotaria magnacalcarata]